MFSKSFCIQAMTRDEYYYKRRSGTRVRSSTCFHFVRPKHVPSVPKRKNGPADWRTLSLERFNMQPPFLLGGSSVAPGFVPVTLQPRVCDHNH
ncbi:hypothetical protein TNCV_3114371 [Trichonephila clavipes]|nr:hypothetical protein TNCV_3114371 [Trichonephila clavipes]